MSESSDAPLKLQFDRRVRPDFRGAAITSDAGLLACRELDAALGLTETANDYIHESRTGRNVRATPFGGWVVTTDSIHKSSRLIRNGCAEGLSPSAGSLV